MANIIKYLEKEMEKGNTLISVYGEIVNREKLERDLKKSYVVALKNGDIDFNVSFPEYSSEVIAKNYGELKTFIDVLYRNNFLFNPETPDMPEPQDEFPKKKYHNK